MRAMQDLLDELQAGGRDIGSLECDIAIAFDDVPLNYIRSVQHGQDMPYFWHKSDKKAPYWTPEYLRRVDLALSFRAEKFPATAWQLASDCSFVLEMPEPIKVTGKSYAEAIVSAMILARIRSAGAVG